MNIEKLKYLLTQVDETPKCEFKLRYILSGQGRSKALDELAKDIIALTNTAGRNPDDYAYLIIGAGNKLNPDGTRNCEDVRQYKYERKALLETVNARCDPKIPDIIYQELELEGNYYAIITIPPSPYMHMLTRDLDTPKGAWRRGSVLIRHGDEVAVASFDEMLLLKKEKETISTTPAFSSQITVLLSKIQSMTIPVSQCVAEALAIARKANRLSLERFCNKELLGWDSLDFDESSEYRPTYRLVEVYIGTSPLNMQYVGFESGASILDFLRHSEHFTASKMVMRRPLSEIESKMPADPNKGVGYILTELRQINPNAKNPDDQVYLYFSSDTFARIAQAVRTELTKQLIDMLPEFQVV